MRFNANHYVKVRLTEHGREIYRQQVDEMNAYLRKVNPDAELFGYDQIQETDGWSRWQLWDLMKTFGPYIAMTRPLLFEMEIEIETEQV